jgi:hypothetical protein
VLAGDPESHLAHQVILLAVRRVEQADGAEFAEAGRGLRGAGACAAVDVAPVAGLERPGGADRGQRDEIDAAYIADQATDLPTFLRQGLEAIQANGE